jgi:hypothetical protein
MEDSKKHTTIIPQDVTKQQQEKARKEYWRDYWSGKLPNAVPPQEHSAPQVTPQSGTDPAPIYTQFQGASWSGVVVPMDLSAAVGDTRRVLAEAGYAAGEIDALAAAGVIATSGQPG